MSELCDRLPDDAHICIVRPGACIACERRGLDLAIAVDEVGPICFGCLEERGEVPFEEALGLVLWRVRRARDLG